MTDLSGFVKTGLRKNHDFFQRHLANILTWQ